MLCELPKDAKNDVNEYKRIVTPKTILSTVNFDSLFAKTIENYAICGRELIKF
jgi:hypothetical protein